MVRANIVGSDVIHETWINATTCDGLLTITINYGVANGVGARCRAVRFAAPTRAAHVAADEFDPVVARKV